jgi:hypothetical protein
MKESKVPEGIQTHSSEGKWFDEVGNINHSAMQLLECVWLISKIPFPLKKKKNVCLIGIYIKLTQYRSYGNVPA